MNQKNTMKYLSNAKKNINKKDGCNHSRKDFKLAVERMLKAGK